MMTGLQVREGGREFSSRKVYPGSHQGKRLGLVLVSVAQPLPFLTSREQATDQELPLGHSSPLELTARLRFILCIFMVALC